MRTSLQDEHRTSTSAAKLPENFRLVRLHLAREQGHPEGDAAHGYDILTPLREDGSIDVDGYKAQPSACRVRRFRPGEDDAIGHLVHGPGGAWLIEYDGAAATGEERGFHFRDERFHVGEYVSIREDDQQMHTFKVWEVRRP
jgi:hypothetical protein